jgi:WD40 repeat protein/serine/threonine protein kinase
MIEEDLFHRALEKPTLAEQLAFLDEACTDQPELRERVERLLRSHRQEDSFLHAGVTTDQPPREAAGAAIGPYKLIEQIGEGGMGTVWMAQQTEPVKRVVALKLIKAGMGSKQVIARFEAERQALALMDHPNIAKVFDAGYVGQVSNLSGQAGSLPHGGRPYFVMELVKGIPVTKYCDEHHLTPRQRLELFIPVCHAIQHAHQKGIIHRDLKPSNVLVAQHDGRPVPKVIDFGVAKAAGQPLTEQTLVTGFGAIVGTLEYMSPEQAELNQLDIDTRSDIYSLGVLLYELLTGSTPFNKKDLEKAGMLEMLRVIREQEPSKPSTKLSTADALPTLAANRGTEPAKLTKLVRGELDWIVMKALEKDRNRRYETASGFAMDVQRYLADEAVQACPPSASYRFRKFARRHRRAVLTASVVSVAAVVTASVVSVAAVQLAEARAQAASDLATAEAEARSRLESQLYRQRIALAEREWSANNLSRMDALLDLCPPDLRDWEWHYLKRLRHSTQSPLRHEGPALHAAFSHDGLLATSTQGGVVRIWQAETRQELQKWRAHDSGVTTVQFSRDGRFLATGSWDNTVKVWEVEKVLRGEVESPLCRWEHTTARVWSVAFSPDSRWLASAGGKEADKTGEFNVWDMNTGLKAFPTKTFTWAVRGVQFSPDGRRLATACRELVQVWDAQTGEEQVLPFPCRDRDGILQEVVFSPDGRRLAAVGRSNSIHPDREVKVWDATTGAEVHSLPGHVGGLWRVAFSPDGRRLASTGVDQTVKVWDAQTGEEILTLRGHLDEVLSVAFSPDGSKLASASMDNTVRVWDGSPLEAVPTSEYRTLRGHAGAVTDVAFDPKDGRILVSAGMDGTVRKWDFQAGTEFVPRQRVAGRIPKVAISPDGRRLALSAGNYPVRVWDTTTGTEGLPFRGHTAAVSCMAFSPDRRHMALTDGDSFLRVWDVTTAREVRVLKGPNWPAGVAFSPEGRHLATGSSDGIVRVWDWKSDDELPAQQLEHTGRVTSVDFSPDGKRLASAGWGRTVKVWNTVSWELLHELPQPSAVQCVAFGRDGRRLGWGGTDGTVTVWDGPGTEALVLRGHTSWIQAVAFSPEGQWIASASLDGTVKIWTAPPEAKAPAPKAGEQGE